MRPVIIFNFFFLLCLPGTKSNRHGSKWQELSKINHLLRDLMSVLMSCYQVNFMLFCLKRQFNSSNDCICIVWDNVLKNYIFTQIVARLCKFWDIFIFALVSFFATTSSYNCMNLRNNTRLWCQKTFFVEVGALVWLKFGSKPFTIPQIIFFVGLQHLKMMIRSLHKKAL